MAAVGQYVIHDVSMFRCKTTDDVLAKIKQVHESTPGNEMLAFQGFNHSMQSPTKEFLTRDDLNKISKDRPLVVTHNTGHFCIVNDAAFKMAGMESQDTQDYPAGGHFQRDSTGRRTGVCEESLSIEFMKFQAQPGPEDMAKFIGLMLDEFAKKGLTTVAEAWAVGISEVEKALALYELVEGSGGMGTRLGFHSGTLQTPGPKDLMPLLKAKGYTQSVPGAPVFSPASPSNGHLLSVSGIKMVSDASGQGKTAFVTEPYNNPLPGNPVGSMNFPTAEILAKFQEIKAAGFSPMVHAIGDKAQDVVMDCFETIWGNQEVYGKEGANWRLRLEHMTVSREEQNPRMKRLGVFPSCWYRLTPLAMRSLLTDRLYFSDMSSFYYWLGDFCHDEVFGPHLKTRITPWGSAQRHEICWNPHSDTPVVPIQPIRDWSVLISRKTAKGNVFSPEQGVERMQALKALTLNGATALGLEKITGSLEVAKFADLVVLDGDPVECSVEELGEVSVAETWLVGKRRVW
jgi:predicted amidohydrolase YtcJ